MDAQSILQTFGQTYHVDMTPSESNVCSARFDNDTIDFEIADRFLYLIGVVSENVMNDKVHQKLLGANLDLTRNGGGFFAYDAQDRVMILLRPLVMPMEYSDFENALVHFLQAVRQWKVEIENLPSETGTAELSFANMDIIAV